MDFRPSSEQIALQEGIRAFGDDRLPPSALGDLAEAGVPHRALHEELAGLGVFQIRVPEADGGLGLGMADAVLVFAELGRRLFPGPLVYSALAAGIVEGAESGRTIVGGHDETAGEGGPILVEHFDALDTLLVLRPGGVFAVTPGALAGKALASPVDPLTPLHEVAGLPEGERLGDDALAARLRRDGMALTAALALGVAEETLALALTHAKAREQFDRPIGSFQAVKHILADMFARLELARAAVYAAGATIDHPEAGDPERAARGAKLLADEAAMKNARACIQVHGGMGYTWETPAHYYLKRCWVLGSTFGTAEEHADHLGDALGAGAER